MIHKLVRDSLRRGLAARRPVGVAGARLSRGGFGDNLTNGLENYNKDVWAGRGTVGW